MPTLVNDWGDYAWFISTYLPTQTIPILRQFGNVIETKSGQYLGIRSTERKDSLVAKIKVGFDQLRNRNDLESYRQIRFQCENVGRPSRSVAGQYYLPPPPTFGGIPAPSSSTVAPASTTSSTSRYNAFDPASSYRPAMAFNATTRPGGTSGWGQVQGASNIYSQRGTGQTPTHPALQDWRQNPMWKTVTAITSMEMLPDILASDNSHTRRERRLSLYFPPEVVEKLQKTRADPNTAPHYSLRLFCTSSEFYRPTNQVLFSHSSLATNQSIPIDYPSNPDISIDGMGVPFKERGLRGKPGSAPPIDLGRTSHPLTLASSRHINVVFGHTGPTTGKRKDQAKRFFFQVVLAEMIKKEELLDRLLKLTPTSVEEALDAARKRIEDDDIVAGASKMTLKDPLSYMRITQPIRSSKCSHVQCFDATWWIESNTQHPQFLCPLCSQALNFEDLIVDGYFQSILNAVPESVEEVVVESDYEWHTEDNKYASANWREDHPLESAPTVTNSNGTRPPTPPLAPDDRAPWTRSPSKALDQETTIKGKRKAIEVVSSDESDEDAPLSRHPRTLNGYSASTPSSHYPSVPPALGRTQSSTATPAPKDNNVIDLTLDSSDDETDNESPNPRPRQVFRQPDVGLSSRDGVESTRQNLPHREPPSLGPVATMASGVRSSASTASTSNSTSTSTLALNAPPQHSHAGASPTSSFTPLHNPNAPSYYQVGSNHLQAPNRGLPSIDTSPMNFDSPGLFRASASPYPSSATGAAIAMSTDQIQNRGGLTSPSEPTSVPKSTSPMVSTGETSLTTSPDPGLWDDDEDWARFAATTATAAAKNSSDGDRNSNGNRNGKGKGNDNGNLNPNPSTAARNGRLSASEWLEEDLSNQTSRFHR